MSQNTNIIEPLVDGVIEAATLIFKGIAKLIGYNKKDFNLFFKNTRLCIGDGEKKLYPVEEEFLIEDEENYDCFDRYLFSVPIGISLEDFESRREKFAHFLGVDEKNIRFKRRGYDIELKIIKNMPKAIYDPEVHKMKGFKIPIGINLETLETRYFDLSDSANANIYVAGSARCGKSNLIRLISTMLIQKSVADIQISWINIKRVDCIEFKECKNTIYYTEEEDKANEILQENLDEMKKRYITFTKSKVKNIWDYRSRVQKMPIRIIVIEEIAVFEKNNKFHETLRLIAQQGTAAGVFLLIATQLPNKDVLPNLTKQNINTTFGGKCKDSIRSDIIIEDGELNKLKGKGHMKVFDCEEYGTEIQVFWVDDHIVEEIANKNIKRSIKEKRAIEAATSITHDDNNIPG